jgi:hypothetical protein
MYLFHLFRSFLPMHNPIGFGAADFVELALAATLLGLACLWREGVEKAARRLAERTVLCMALLTALPIALRLLLLSRFPIPTASVSDDYSYLLLADTLRHFRLANPPQPLQQFFETYFVLQQPTYSSIFPLGQGIVLVLGWAGVALSIGALCALCYWMLRAWTSPGWALVGGVLAAIQFGPLNQWMNSFWGGAVAACAGCLVLGSLARLRTAYHRRDAILLGLGMGIHLLTRPYESIFLFVGILLLFPWRLRSAAVIGVLAMLPAVGLTLLHNHAVTGSWATLPYQLSRYQYGVPAAFTCESNPTPHRELTPQQKLDYDVQSAVHGVGRDTPATYMARFASRLRFYRFFLLAPLYLAIPFFLPSLREYRFAVAAAIIALFALGTNFYPYFYSHYIAAVTCLLVLVGVAGLERLSRLSPEAARAILFLCAAHFLFWYGINTLASEDIRVAVTRYETWDAINQGDPEGRIAINERLDREAGRHLVFVRYSDLHQLKEWVHNQADLGASRVVWARDLGEQENEKLEQYYPDRTSWLLEPDALPPRLTRLR